MVAASGLAERLFSALRKIDAEATTARAGSPTGLNWYGAHVRPDEKRPKTEPHWSRRLAELLRADGLEADCEVPYPPTSGARTRCDLVVALDGTKTWIEVKGGAGRSIGAGMEARICTARTSLVPGLDPKTHTAALDLEKLGTLNAPVASQVGLLLVGFDSQEAPMDGDVHELVRLAELDVEPWTATLTGWPDAARPGQRVRCWFWLRPVRI